MCTDSRRHFLLRSALVLGAASSPLTFAANTPPRAATGVRTYICPPCGCAADGQEFSQPGNCPACAMALVEKPAGGSSARPRVAILVFEGVQIIDFAAPYEVFGEAGYDVFTVGATKVPIETNMHLTITPRYSFADAPKPDVLLLPGGNIDGALSQREVIEWLRARSAEATQTVSVCNGAFFLATGRLLEGLSATTYYGRIDQLKAQFPNITVVSDRRFVDNGRIVTTAGLSSGIDGALHIVSKLSGRAAAQMVALNMEYNWREDAAYARANFADRHLRRIFGGRLQLSVPVGSAEVESTAGDSNAWEARWLIRGSSSAASVSQAISDIVAAKSDWKLVAGGKSDTQRRWTFADENQRKWHARLDTANAEADGTLRSTLTLRATG